MIPPLLSKHLSLVFVSSSLPSLSIQFLSQWTLVFPTSLTSNVYACCHEVSQLKRINFNLLSLSLLRKTSQSISWHITDDSQIQGNPTLPSICIFNLMGFQTIFKPICKEYTLLWSDWDKTKILKFQKLLREFKGLQCFCISWRENIYFYQDTRWRFDLMPGSSLNFLPPPPHGHLLLVDCSASPLQSNSKSNKNQNPPSSWAKWLENS